MSVEVTLREIDYLKEHKDFWKRLFSCVCVCTHVCIPVSVLGFPCVPFSIWQQEISPAPGVDFLLIQTSHQDWTHYSFSVFNQPLMAIRWSVRSTESAACYTILGAKSFQADTPRSQSQLHLLSAVTPWAQSLNTTRLIFPICQMGRITYSPSPTWKWNHTLLSTWVFHFELP